MENKWFQCCVRRWIVIVFWFIVLAIFLGIYFFAPSLFHQMEQTSYQKTPYVDTPSNP